uniref:DUF928 domain-containing protein n=1 Tax=Oscillatoriales cyanobacterium SpSt-402 TaxID=2282168 RepID=A0A832H559_9CYAN
MNRTLNFQQIFNPGFVLLFIGMVWAIYSVPALANAKTGESASKFAHPISSGMAQNRRVEPPDRGTPPSGRGTGSRSGDCLQKPNHPPLTLLVGKEGFDQTVTPHPTFWVYIPYTSNEAPTGEFALQDEQGQEDLYRIQFQLPSTPGIISVTPPETVPALSPGKSYRWYFEVNCSTRTTLRDPTPASVTGLVKRVAAPAMLINELKEAGTPLQRAVSYAKHGFWFDSITEMGQLRLSQPQNEAVKQAWIDLLESEVELRSIADQAIVGRITASSPLK